MRRLLLIFVLFVSTPLLADPIYQWVDEHGRPQFGDQPPDDSKAQPVQLGRVNTYDSPSQIFIDETLAREITHPQRRASVLLYSADWCGVCKRAKHWLDQQRVPYSLRDIEKDPQAQREYQALQARGVPVILVGKQRMNGFSENNMLTMLRNAGYRI